MPGWAYFLLGVIATLLFLLLFGYIHPAPAR